jgi:hypothetical protein
LKKRIILGRIGTTGGRQSMAVQGRIENGVPAHNQNTGQVIQSGNPGRHPFRSFERSRRIQ